MLKQNISPLCKCQLFEYVYKIFSLSFEENLNGDSRLYFRYIFKFSKGVPVSLFAFCSLRAFLCYSVGSIKIEFPKLMFNITIKSYHLKRRTS